MQGRIHTVHSTQTHTPAIGNVRSKITFLPILTIPTKPSIRWIRDFLPNPNHHVALLFYTTYAFVCVFFFVDDHSNLQRYLLIVLNITIAHRQWCSQQLKIFANSNYLSSTILWNRKVQLCISHIYTTLNYVSYFEVYYVIFCGEESADWTECVNSSGNTKK